eukprot:scaffold124549_cov43-Prasinocladus_malaysianus.AAC.2
MEFTSTRSGRPCCMSTKHVYYRTRTSAAYECEYFVLGSNNSVQTMRRLSGGLARRKLSSATESRIYRVLLMEFEEINDPDRVQKRQVVAPPGGSDQQQQARGYVASFNV